MTLHEKLQDVHNMLALDKRQPLYNVQTYGKDNMLTLEDHLHLYHYHPTACGTLLGDLSPAKRKNMSDPLYISTFSRHITWKTKTKGTWKLSKQINLLII